MTPQWLYHFLGYSCQPLDLPTLCIQAEVDALDGLALS